MFMCWLKQFKFVREPCIAQSNTNSKIQEIQNEAKIKYTIPPGPAPILYLLLFYFLGHALPQIPARTYTILDAAMRTMYHPNWEVENILREHS